MNFIIISLENQIFQELLIEKISSMVDNRQVHVGTKQDFSFLELKGETQIEIRERGYAGGHSLGGKVIYLEMYSDLKGLLRKLIQCMAELEMPVTDYMEKMTEQGLKQSDVLTKREKEVVFLIAKGMLNKEIAEELHIAERTVKNHISNIFKKLNVYDRTQLAVYAIKNGIYQM